MKSETKYIALVGIVLLAAVSFLVVNLDFGQRTVIHTELGEVKTFSSLNELEEFVKQSQGDNSYGGELYAERAGGAVTSGGVAAPNVASAESAQDSSTKGSDGSSDYSETNIQVEGVDEPDITKNDGKYIYTVAGNKVAIVEAYPAEGMKILSEITFENDGINNLFINGDRLIVFTQSWGEVYYYGEGDDIAAARPASGSAVADSKIGVGIWPGPSGRQEVNVNVYDVSDRENPTLERKISFEGSYTDARMIEDYVYLISSKYVDYQNPVPPIYRTFAEGVTKEFSVDVGRIYYPYYYDYSYQFTSVNAIDLADGDVNSEVFMLGSTGTTYVSENNIYLTGRKTLSQKENFELYVEMVANEVTEKKEDVDKVLNSNYEDWQKQREIDEIISDYSYSLRGEERAEFDKRIENAINDYYKEITQRQDKTSISKISIDELEIEYDATGEVKGSLLNQFSMDESGDYFRVATTSGEFWSGTSVNNLFVLDDDLQVVGSIEDLAPGERIYSARFMGERAYLVTFKKVDPFYVIDLSEAEEPKVLGYLKIPGYSDYLHLYDENHVIGIGKEAVDAEDSETFGRSDFAWYQGLKISIFDVTDVENPVEWGRIVIGDRGTGSSALYDHKAFLFDKEKNLLVLPIDLYEINEDRYSGELPDTAYGEQVWSGAYVFDIAVDEIKVRGKVTHHEGEFDYRYLDWNENIARSLYMDDVLYTISPAKIKANDLNTVEEISSVRLQPKQTYPDYPFY